MMIKLLVLFLLVLIPTVQAHGTGTEAVVGDYFIEFGTIPSPPSGTEATSIIFGLEDTSRNRIPQTEAFVRITSDGKVVFASSSLKTDMSGTLSLSYLFETPGEYQVTVCFLPQDVSHTFQVIVPPKDDYFIILELLVAFGIGYGLAILLSRKKKRKR